MVGGAEDGIKGFRRSEAGEFSQRRCEGVRPWGEEVAESFRVGVYTLTLKDCS